tara:strand:- start:314 stop:508 length:195 start_codon:yes stop_codon:yes gene_type:complete
MTHSNYTDAQLSYAMRDIKETLALHKDKPVTDTYVLKLHEERDSILGEISKRCQAEYNKRYATK